jgi:hypothetical protein
MPLSADTRRFSTFNEQRAEMLGLSLDDTEPTLDAREQRVHPGGTNEANATLDAHFAGRLDYFDTEHRMETAAGEWTWTETVGRWQGGDNGEPVRTAGVYVGTTDQRERRQEPGELVELVGYDGTILGSEPSLVEDEAVRVGAVWEQNPVSRPSVGPRRAGKQAPTVVSVPERENPFYGPRNPETVLA